MSERLTPETDACIIERRHIYKRDGSNQLLELIDAEFARKMERERDEAQELFESSKRARASLSEACDYLQKKLKETKRERDEAREKMADALQEVDLRTLDYERMKQERDEAREVLREISEASGFDNIGNWARNKANDALKNKN